MEYFKSLPADITLDILTRLPSELVLECKSVSKTWYNLISHHPSFSKRHLHHLNHPYPSNADSAGKLSFIALTGFMQFHFLEYNENHGESEPTGRIRKMNLPPPWHSVKFVGSCNGLVCLARPPYLTVRTFICNPITREYVRLPEINKYADDAHWTCGFGYVASTNEYKVVAIMSTDFEEVFVYTLGSGKGWRNLGKLKIGESTYDWELGVFANGALYWKDIELGMITAFDLADEKFSEKISPPPLLRDTHWGCHELGVLDGVLFFSTYLDDGEADFFDIWLLKKKNDNQDKKQGKGSASKKNKKRKGKEHLSLGWSKEFTIEKSQLLAVTRSGGVLTYTDYCLNICDTRASTSKRLVDFKELVHRILPHKNTLVSVKELGEEDTHIMESIELIEDVTPRFQLMTVNLR